MKLNKSITSIALAAANCLLVCSVSGQANFALWNHYTACDVDAPVFDSQGLALEGSNYRVELWGGATMDNLAPASNLDQNGARLIVPFGMDGYFFSPASSLSIPTVPGFGYAWLEVRAWDARLGATYEDVAALEMGGYGQSPLFYARGGDAFDQFHEPAPLIGLQSFSLLPIPEPSTWALFCVAGVALVWLRRHKP